MAILAIGAGALMTALAVAIGGLFLEALLILLSRSCATAGKAASPTVIHLRENGKPVGAIKWAEEAAA